MEGILLFMGREVTCDLFLSGPRPLNMSVQRLANSSRRSPAFGAAVGGVQAFGAAVGGVRGQISTDVTTKWWTGTGTDSLARAGVTLQRQLSLAAAVWNAST